MWGGAPGAALAEGGVAYGPRGLPAGSWELRGSSIGGTEPGLWMGRASRTVLFQAVACVLGDARSHW